MGAEFVSQLAGQGARVAFIDIDLDRGKALEQALRDDGADALLAECDVRDVPAVQGAIARSAEQLGPVRVLVNNAAYDHRDKVAEMDQPPGTRYVLATENQFALLGPDLTEQTVLPPVFTDPLIRMNDGGCDPQGRFFCGTMAYDETP